MKHVHRHDIRPDTKEEILPGFTEEFPYIASYAELETFPEPMAPWHWHRAVEIFYMKSGTLEYTTPHGKWVFPAGSGGLVNANVLHTSKVMPCRDRNIQLLHLFDASFLSGGYGSRMESKYILPITSAAGLEMIPLYPDDPACAPMLEKLRQSFEIQEGEWGYEFRLRQQLTELWLEFFELARPRIERTEKHRDGDDKIKMLMVYIHEHYPEPISIDQLAQAAHVSKRVCFRLFQENLHMTPLEYLRGYRLRMACQMLQKTKEPITQIAYACGLGTSSYFGKTFREHYGCTPAQYRKKWQDRDTNGRT